MYYIGKFYVFLLFEEDDGTVYISNFKEKYKNIDEAKEQIRIWKEKNKP